MAKKKSAEERRRRAAELKAQRMKEERRRRTWRIAGVTTAAVLVVGLIVFLIVMELRSRNIEGVQEFEDVTNTHVEVGERVDYEQSPPIGGDHWASWQNCGVYPEPVTPELAVHSMEHGAVWINYDPDLPEEDVEALNGMYNSGDYLIVSPYDGEMDAPIVASSWARQITAESPDDDDLTRYVQLYERGQDVPEPGAPCSGQISETADEVEEQMELTGGAGGEGGDPEADNGSEDEADSDGGDEAGDEENE